MSQHPAPTERLIVGAMSGTSADGVDAALVRISGRGLEMRAELIRHHQRPYPPRLAANILALRSRGETTLKELADVGRVVSLVYAVAVNELLVVSATAPEQIACVAAHGQTLFHAPPLTIQWLDPALLAARTGCRVVSDFRRADCALGGQGAPLVPYADYILFRDAARGRVLVNIGGIANITWLPAGGGLEQLVAFDTGPGNCICDSLVQSRARALARAESGLSFDAGGQMALRGQALSPLVEAVLADPYFAAQPPKTTDGPAMIAIFQRELERLQLSTAPLPDLLATAVEVTARSLVGAAQWLPGLSAADTDWIFAGGGVKNLALQQAIQRLLGRPLATTDAHGIPAQAREAVAFALLGAATLDGTPASVPSATGATRAAVLGCITPVP